MFFPDFSHYTLHPYNRKAALHSSHQGEGGPACSHLLPEVMTTPHFPKSWPQPLSRSLWFPPRPFPGAGRVLGVLGNGCVPTALSRPRLPHHPPVACLPAGQCSGQPVGLRALGASSGHPVCLPVACCPRARLLQGEGARVRVFGCGTGQVGETWGH